MNKPDLLSLNFDEVKNLISLSGEADYKAKQVYLWARKGIDSFDEMSNVSKSLREKLEENTYLATVRIERKFVSKIDGTVKYLFKLSDGAFIEGVLMKYKHGYSMCISSQVGCRMGCNFCASTLLGLERNLTAGEMLGQIIKAQNDNNIRISNIVLMGMGEPLDNFDNVLRFLELVSDKDGLSVGHRHISLSTCGRVDGIYKLLEYNLQITLSVSLHAPFDDMRTGMMPINKKYNIEKLLCACKDYTDKTHRRISFEYSLIEGLNDTKECAQKLAFLLKGILCHVNLIPINEVKEREYKKSKNVYNFQKMLTEKGINATVRRTLGSDIDASCGQLRQRIKNEL